MRTVLLKATRRRVLAELDRVARRFEPRVAAAFLDAVRTVRSQASLRAIAAALEVGDLQRVLDAVRADALAGQLLGRGVEPGRASVQDELLGALRAGADVGMTQLPRAAAMAATLDLTNPESVAYLRDHLPTLVREVTEEQRRAVRAAVTRGFTEGRHPYAVAREVRGTVGLTEAMEGYVANFRRQLETGELAGATPPWDRRLSAVERAAARSEFRAAATDPARVDRLVDRYRESLVNRRAQNIARTEVNRASGAGQAELWRQAEAEGLVDLTRTRRVWIVTPDEQLRPDHAAVPGMNPDGVGLDEPFATPVGPVMHPRESGDPGFDVNCRCAEALVFTS